MCSDLYKRPRDAWDAYGFKKGGKYQRLASSFRPSSLLPTIGKVLEKLDSEADLSSRVHQRHELTTAWLQRRKVCGYSHQRATKKN
ncbi:hypothetical protein AVEN_267137-1 [Araneus ventricosus]|uniref:Uncharacterized protein n=1 Tax=Araneus ventricosus TaxID=182803 RepID=A0A4Y2GEZ2_ARAVE|nr:hypothetical protein AVEN_267137-1 [Araneus ventricosus]